MSITVKSDPVVDRYLGKHIHLPQFQKERHGDRVVKFRFCRLCGAKTEAGEEYRSHMKGHA